MTKNKHRKRLKNFDKAYTMAEIEIEKIIDGPWHLQKNKMFYNKDCYLEYKNSKIILVQILKTKFNKRKIKKYIVSDVFNKNTHKGKILQDFINYRLLDKRLNHANYLISADLDYCNFFKFDRHRLYSVEKEKDKYIRDYPQNIKNTIIALNKYIFEGFDYCFQKTDFILLSNFSGRLYPYINYFYLPIHIELLSGHKKLLAQEELFNLLSKTD